MSRRSGGTDPAAPACSQVSCRSRAGGWSSLIRMLMECLVCVRNGHEAWGQGEEFCLQEDHQGMFKEEPPLLSGNRLHNKREQ